MFFAEIDDIVSMSLALSLVQVTLAILNHGQAHIVELGGDVLFEFKFVVEVSFLFSSVNFRMQWEFIELLAVIRQMIKLEAVLCFTLLAKCYIVTHRQH